MELQLVLEHEYPLVPELPDRVVTVKYKAAEPETEKSVDLEPVVILGTSSGSNSKHSKAPGQPKRKLKKHSRPRT